MKRFLIALLIGLCIVLIAFVPDLSNYVLSLFIPPRLYIVIGLVVIVLLLKIYNELKNKRDD